MATFDDTLPMAWTTSESATPTASPLPALPFVFTGTGSEYFRIWIVNLVLSIVTLGIYSAWAKVRRQQYFYRNTRLGETGFDYHGEPMAILKGRFIAACLFGAYYFAGYASPLIGTLVFVLLTLIFPWLVARSLRFRMHNSSYRGLRFHFSGSTREAYWVFVGLPILSVLSLLTLAPLWHHRLKSYQHAHAAFGRTPFTFDAPVSGFYRIYLMVAGGLLVTAVVAVMLITAGSMGMTADSEAGGVDPAITATLFAAMIGIAVYGFVGLGLWSLITARVQNLVWMHTRLGPHSFICTLQWRRLFFISLTNVIGIVLTLGLFKPFAQVRLAHYMTSALSVVPVGTFDDFVAGERQNVTAFGEEALDIFDVDLGF